jgi:hypothetical protein
MRTARTLQGNWGLMPFCRVQARGLLHAARMAADPDVIRWPGSQSTARALDPAPLWEFRSSGRIGTRRRLFQRYNDTTVSDNHRQPSIAAAPGRRVSNIVEKTRSHPITSATKTVISAKYDARSSVVLFALAITTYYSQLPPGRRSSCGRESVGL